MNDERHYSDFGEGFLPVSSNALVRLNNYVEVCRGLVKSGVETHGRTKNFTFAVRKWRVVEIGWNDYGRKVLNIPRLGNLKYYNPSEHGESKYRPSLHSEMSCMMRLGNSVGTDGFRDYDVVNVRVDCTKSMNCAMSAPCVNCRQALRLLRVRKIFFFDGGEWRCMRGR